MCSVENLPFDYFVRGRVKKHMLTLDKILRKALPETAGVRVKPQQRADPTSNAARISRRLMAKEQSDRVRNEKQLREDATGITAELT